MPDATKPVKQTKIKQRKPTTRRKSSKSRKKSGSWLHNCPSWTIWLGAILIACAYAYLLNYFFVDNFSFRWKALYGNSPTPDGYEVRGIDISHYQGQIDWKKVRNAKVDKVPLRFVIIKATEGEKLIDENFSDNFFRAKENDIIRGAYHYFIPNLNAEKQARFFMKQAHLESGDLPPILDVEDRGTKPLATFQKDVHKWLDLVEEEYGIKPIIYTGYKFKLDYLNDSSFSQYPYWIAHYYVKELKYQGDWAIWQYTDCGHVDGIRGYVDCNIFNGDIAALNRLTIPFDTLEE